MFPRVSHLLGPRACEGWGKGSMAGLYVHTLGGKKQSILLATCDGHAFLITFWPPSTYEL